MPDDPTFETFEDVADWINSQNEEDNQITVTDAKRLIAHGYVLPNNKHLSLRDRVLDMAPDRNWVTDPTWTEPVSELAPGSEGGPALDPIPGAEAEPTDEVKARENSE